MSDAEDNAALADTLADAIAQPRRARTEAGEFEAQPLADQVKAAEFVMKQRASGRSPFSCLHHAKTELPGGSS